VCVIEPPGANGLAPACAGALVAAELVAAGDDAPPVLVAVDDATTLPPLVAALRARA
jgi:hypothetical protein